MWLSCFVFVCFLKKKEKRNLGISCGTFLVLFLLTCFSQIHDSLSPPIVQRPRFYFALSFSCPSVTPTSCSRYCFSYVVLIFFFFCMFQAIRYFFKVYNQKKIVWRNVHKEHGHWVSLSCTLPARTTHTAWTQHSRPQRHLELVTEDWGEGGATPPYVHRKRKRTEKIFKNNKLIKTQTHTHNTHTTIVSVRASQRCLVWSRER